MIGFIGLGNMASAIIGGLLKKKLVSEEEIIGMDVLFSAREKAEDEFGIRAVETIAEVAKKADYLFLAVKPQYFPDVIGELKDVLREDTVVISIAAGKTMEAIQDLFGKEIKLVRCMPNTPALVLAGCTAVVQGDLVSDGEMEYVKKLLTSFGTVSEVSESMIDVVVGISGSSPAYVFMFIEAMADAAVLEGMPRKQAYEMAAQAVFGSAKLMLESGKHPGELKDMVCSPGGTTIEAVRTLEENGFRGVVMDAVAVCVEKSRTM